MIKEQAGLRNTLEKYIGDILFFQAKAIEMIREQESLK